MSEVLPDDYLQFAIYDAMRGVRIPTLKRALTEDERRVLADAVFAAVNRGAGRSAIPRSSERAYNVRG